MTTNKEYEGKKGIAGFFPLSIPHAALDDYSFTVNEEVVSSNDSSKCI